MKTRLFRMWRASRMWRDSFARVPWLMRTCAYVLRASFEKDAPLCVCVTWLIRTCAITHNSFVHVVYEHISFGKDAPLCASHLILTKSASLRTCGVTPSHVCHDSFVCVAYERAFSKKTRPHCAKDATLSYMWRDSFARVPWRIRVCDVPHLYVCSSSSAQGGWRQSETDDGVGCGGEPRDWVAAAGRRVVCEVTHSCVWCESSHVCGVTRLYVWRDSFVCVTRRIHICDAGVRRSGGPREWVAAAGRGVVYHTHEQVTTHVQMSRAINTNQSHHTHQCGR